MLNKTITVKTINSVDPNFIDSFNRILANNSIWEYQTAWDNSKGEEFIANPSNVLLVAYKDQQIAGYLTAHRLQSFETKSEVMIYDVGVHKDFRQQGVGKALLEAVKAWAKAAGANTAWILCHRSNPAAMALYASVGGVEADPDLVMFDFKI